MILNLLASTQALEPNRMIIMLQTNNMWEMYELKSYHIDLTFKWL